MYINVNIVHAGKREKQMLLGIGPKISTMKTFLQRNFPDLHVRYIYNTVHVYSELVYVHCTSVRNLHATGPLCRCMSESGIKFGQQVKLMYAIDHPHVRCARERVKLETNS